MQIEPLTMQLRAQLRRPLIRRKSGQVIFVLVLLWMLLLAGCSMTPGRGSAQQELGVDTKNSATLALLGTAKRQTEAGDLEAAAAVIERALRIEPANPGLWHQLAKIRFAQGQYSTAINLAAKSNSYARRNSELISRNRQLIQQARLR